MFSLEPNVAEELFENFRKSRSATDFDPVPPLKIFSPWAPMTWLVSEIDPQHPTTGYGLADLGMGEPEFGLLDLRALSEVQGPAGQSLQIDKYWQPDHTISEYTKQATKAGRIIF